MGANGAFLGEISEIVSPMLILDNQSSVQDLLSLCLSDHLQEAERREPKPSHKEVSTSCCVALVLLGRNCHPLFSKGDGAWQAWHRSAQICWTLVPRVLDWAGSDAWQGTGQCPTCSLQLNEVLESQKGLGSKGP